MASNPFGQYSRQPTRTTYLDNPCEFFKTFAICHSSFTRMANMPIRPHDSLLRATIKGSAGRTRMRSDS